MKLSEIQSHHISHRINVPFPIKWSDDDVIATATEKGIQLLKSSAMTSRDMILNWCSNASTTSITRITYVVMILLSVIIHPSLCSDTKSNITYEVFGDATNNMPAAFGDFDSDKYTDLFVITKDSKTVKILLGSDTEPFLRESDGLKCTFKSDVQITSVVPGDFDGDAFMDVLVTARNGNGRGGPHNNDVYLLWGHGDKLICSENTLLSLNGQPLAVDWNQDMVIDLFGMKLLDDGSIERGFWIFNKNRTEPTYKKMDVPEHIKHDKLRIPHSHAFLDLNNDNYGDLYLTCSNGSAEVWYYDKSIRDFKFHHSIPAPPGYDFTNKEHIIGQTLFQDMALERKINHVIPVCFKKDCVDSKIFIRSEDERQPRWYSINVNFKNWHLAPPGSGRMYLETLTLRAGDYNMDGYPDLLATLFYNGEYRTNLLENVPCNSIGNCDGFPRTFEVRETALSPYNGNTTLGIFYDFYQNGILDVILVHDKPLMVSAFRNTLDYDANFVKVMVLTGVTHEKPTTFHPLTKKQRIYGTNLPGPTIFYLTTTVEGDPKSAVSTQLPQSAHFSLSLPYTIFGLGRTANFVDELSVGVYGQQGNWTQLIPNSQMVVIPWPSNDAKKWKVKLFVTPSELIIQSFGALLGTCALISLIIGGLYWKERKEDHKEKLQEAQRFHFDAM